jgi:hypothetical protein
MRGLHQEVSQVYDHRPRHWRHTDLVEDQHARRDAAANPVTPPIIATLPP